MTVPEESAMRLESSPTSTLGPAVPIENQSVLILPIPSGYKKALLWFNPAAAQHHTHSHANGVGERAQKCRNLGAEIRTV